MSNNSGQNQLSPSVFWAQTENQITLRVDLKDSKDPELDVTDNTLNFSTYGLGARGKNKYTFSLNFYSKILPEKTNYKMHDSKIDFVIKKQEEMWWPRLIAQPQKPHWLKVDFDKWRSEDDLDDEQVRDIMQDYPGMYEKLQKEEYGYIKEHGKKVYLIFYNLSQFIGYLYIFLVMSILYYRDGPDSIPRAYETVGNAMKFCQLLQYLEVMHPLFGYTKGSPIIPFFQVSGRNFILFLMIESEPRMQTKPAVFYVFLIWSLIEIVRYPYYIMTILNKNIGFLTWLRYTLWIPLYPLGILCEGIIILRNIPYFEETQRFSIDMPNSWNITFSMPTFLKVYLLLLILPGTFMVMSHMTKLRAKKLNTSGYNRKLKNA